MTTLYVDRKDADLDIEGDTLVVRVNGERQGTAPLRLLERVVLRGTAKIATRLVTKLAERGVSLLLLSGRANAPAAILSGQPGGDTALRLAQYDLTRNEEARRVMSVGIVHTKIAGQTRLLHSVMREKPSKPLADAIARIDRASERLASNVTIPERRQLRGIEGAAAAAYFKGFTSLFAPSLDFTGRNRRPPRDPVNVCLSLGYTLLHSDAVRIAAGAGLDPMLGIYHDITPGRESLACDLAEPVRPLVDRWTLGLFESGDLTNDHFSLAQDKVGCRLGKAGREIVYRSFEEEAPLMRRLLTRSVRAVVTELRQRMPAQLPAPDITIEDEP